MLSYGQIPQISYSSTSPKLSDGKQYTYFLRTAPSDELEGKGMADLLKNGFGYTSVAVVNSEDSCELRSCTPNINTTL